MNTLEGLNLDDMAKFLKDQANICTEKGKNEDADVLLKWVAIWPSVGPQIGIITGGPHIYSEKEMEDALQKILLEYKKEHLTDEKRGFMHKATAVVCAGAILLNAIGPYL